MSGASVESGSTAVLAANGAARRALLVSRTALCAALLASAGGVEVRAETISGALVKAYTFSPDLGQQRAATRAADEGISRATAGWRPVVAATASVGDAYEHLVNPISKTLPLANYSTFPRTAGITVTQTLYNGDRTANTVRQAESTVLQSREQLRLSEINILANAATAYMNVLRDTALLNLANNNIQVLQQQLKQTKDRFDVGEVTATDVAQAQAALALGQTNEFTAQSNLQNSLAIYRQLIGDPPHNLAPARPIESLMPKTLAAAISLSQTDHPLIQAALHAVDVASLAVKIQEGALYPTVSVQGNISQSWDASLTPKEQLYALSAIGSLTVPIYDGGLTYASIRQAKEQLGQAQLQADLQRENIRAAVVSAWGAYQNTKASIQSFQAQVRANEVALAGIREEAKVGQRTTFDVLTAQQTLLNSRVGLVSAQRDQVVNSYTLMAAVGRLSAQSLGLGVVSYDPTVHFDQVKDKVWGLRTPDGR